MPAMPETTATESDAAARLWLVFAHERPEDWKRYHGDCSCPGCRRFRLEFNQWVAGRADRLEAENARLRDACREALDYITDCARVSVTQEKSQPGRIASQIRAAIANGTVEAR